MVIGLTRSLVLPSRTRQTIRGRPSGPIAESDPRSWVGAAFHGIEFSIFIVNITKVNSNLSRTKFLFVQRLNSSHSHHQLWRGKPCQPVYSRKATRIAADGVYKLALVSLPVTSSLMQLPKSTLAAKIAAFNFFSFMIIFGVDSISMCRGHPKHHRCAHTSVSWYYCPSAYLDMETGAVSPCGNPIMNDSQPTKAACPLQYCRFSTKGSSWVCCQCNQGPNTRGWCTQKLTALQVGIDPRSSGQLQMTCDHGCCEKCIGLGMHLLPMRMVPDLQPYGPETAPLTIAQALRQALQMEQAHGSLPLRPLMRTQTRVRTREVLKALIGARNGQSGIQTRKGDEISLMV
ncbi:hypothetical protein IF1G_09593 [Cordyceps javanica]|uniref:Uncharacterized protein n=1 Tax=Cordyceps javanica TaxID=43265 RepID=A0A545VPL9_9HYPO|nr:hypothetical protein IF1G_09593 [Cordyceps javanica]TQW03690.1 hypothetical protein IF2G_08988 [Cordyceps javanica]